MKEALNNACRFCAIARGQTFHGSADIPIRTEQRYFAIASIGALMEGWSLAIPTDHCLSLQHHYGSPEFLSFVRNLVYRVESRYGRAVVFEHGANHEGSLTSCGTDHAHLHVVPFKGPLLDVVKRSALTEWKGIRAADLPALVEGSEYLFFSEHPSAPELKGFCHSLTTPVSQFFRKLIAIELGRTSVADYRVHLHLDAANRTRESLALLT